MTTDNKRHAAAPTQALLGRRLGMTQVWDVDDRLVFLIAMQVSTDVVTQVRTEEIDGYSAVQLGSGEIPACKVARPMASHSVKAGVKPHRHLAGVCTPAADNYEPGQELQAVVFEVGQAIDVSGNTRGKGFAGVMERHGFVGVSVSHDAHRNRHKPGSIGVYATPGCIFKGSCTVSRMGNVRRTVQSLKAQVMDAGKGLLLINGTAPGPKNGVVLTCSSVKGA